MLAAPPLARGGDAFGKGCGEVGTVMKMMVFRSFACVVVMMRRWSRRRRGMTNERAMGDMSPRTAFDQIFYHAPSPMTSSSSSTTSLALRELTLRQLEQTNDSLKFQLESLQSRHQSVLDAEERLTKRLQECETDMLKMRQQMEEAKRAEEKALKKMVHDMNEERELARKALVESEERVSSARREVAKLDDLLREATSRGESSSFFSSATTATTTTSTTSNKRAKRGLTGEEEQNHPEVDAERQRLELNELRRKVRELSAENEALQKGVAVSGRAQELASQLSVSQRNERALEEELRRTRRDHQETVPELKSQLTVANAKLKMLEATAREGEARAREAEEWREVFKFVLGETTSAVSTSSNVVVVKREVKDENDPGGEEAEGVSSPARRVVDMIIRLQRGSLECAFFFLFSYGAEGLRDED